MAYEEDFGDIGATSNSILRFANYSRIVFYGIAVWIQLSLFIACRMSLGNCDIMAVLVPLFLVFTDMGLIRWSRNPTKDFMGATLIVSIVSIYLAIRTVSPYSLINPSFTVDQTIMALLSIGVFLVSLIELFMLIFLTRPQERKNETTYSDTIRTYEAQ
ncbi:hypothetical protein EU528_05130 [Candidatus Thorarchaeota archaeon]|nr:MAG: hypothetical protein EU528_05130 [Candidatus Thorarchaeota archaeon]